MFCHFCRGVKERALLLLFDGHLTHVSVNVILKGIEENATILKFPPHITDILQPLDVSSFRLLTRDWERMLNQWCTRDISLVRPSDIIAGPITVLPQKGRKWEMLNYHQIEEHFRFLKGIDRDTLFPIEIT